MKFVTGTPEYDANWDLYFEMTDNIPMTRPERTELHFWVLRGNDINSNPWRFFEVDGSSMNYLKARRICFGASHGPWDSWEYDSYLTPDTDGNLTIIH